MARARPYGLAALSGVLFVLGYPDVGAWPLACVFAIPLLLALEQVGFGVRRAFVLGLLAGTLAHLLGYSWLLPTLTRFSGLPAVACVPIFALFALYQGAAWGGVCALVARAARCGWPPLALWPPAWVAVEWIYPAIFPTPLAVSLHALPAALQIADLGGPGLPSLLLAGCSALGADVLRRRRGDRGQAALGAALVTASVAAALGYGALRTSQVRAGLARAPTLGLALVQANLGLAEKRSDRALALRRHREPSLRLEREHQPDLIVWPETAVPSVVSLDATELSVLTGSLSTPLLTGALGHRTRGGRAELYNAAFLLDRDGRVLGHAEKQVLLPFAEALPFGERFPALYDLVPGSGRFTPGEGSRALVLGPARIAALICYEDILPGFVRAYVRDTRPNLLLNLTNDAWFGDSAAPHIHLALSVLRAIEHRRYLVRATNSGVSAVIDPLGHVVARTRTFTRETLRSRVALLEADTVYARLGDWPGQLGALLALAACAVRRRRGSA